MQQPGTPIPRIKPPALQHGDTVGIVAPASNIQRDLLNAGCDMLRRLGYKPFCLESIFDQDLYFAGSAERVLYGGCLSMLVASLGTPYQIRTAGTILFLEDVATRPFQIDRMLMQLKLAGKLESARGIIFGEMTDCVQHKGQGYTLEEVVLRVVGDLGIPVAFGLRSGHVSQRNVTLPIGVRAALTVDSREARRS